MEDAEEGQPPLVDSACVYPLHWNVHEPLKAPMPGNSLCTRGRYAYYHYGCDGQQDAGWGCAYRTLQTTISWIHYKLKVPAVERKVPSIGQIQQTLVQLGDKPDNFVGSRDWIGAMEVFYVIDALYDVSCKILHVPQRDDLKKYANVLKKYFEDFGGFAMMGGDEDAASKGIAGVHICSNQAYFLVVDPHFVGIPTSAQQLIERGFVRWQHTSEFVDSSFYNICLPQLK